MLENDIELTKTLAINQKWNIIIIHSYFLNLNLERVSSSAKKISRPLTESVSSCKTKFITQVKLMMQYQVSEWNNFWAFQDFKDFKV